MFCVSVCVRRTGELYRIIPVKEFSRKHCVVMEPASREQSGAAHIFPWTRSLRDRVKTVTKKSTERGGGGYNYFKSGSIHPVPDGMQIPLGLCEI